MGSHELKRGHTKSCGCIRLESMKAYGELNKEHGLRRNRLYGTWSRMKDRCYNSNNEDFKNYGGRGITVCDDWLHAPKAFYDWAMTNGYKQGLSIDRINVNGNYSPENCRWADAKMQVRNRRTAIFTEYNGQNVTLLELSELLNIPYSTLHARYRKGERGERLFRPLYLRELYHERNMKNDFL